MEIMRLGEVFQDANSRLQPGFPGNGLQALNCESLESDFDGQVDLRQWGSTGVNDDFLLG